MTVGTRLPRALDIGSATLDIGISMVTENDSRCSIQLQFSGMLDLDIGSGHVRMWVNAILREFERNRGGAGCQMRNQPTQMRNQPTSHLTASHSRVARIISLPLASHSHSHIAIAITASCSNAARAKVTSKADDGRRGDRLNYRTLLRRLFRRLLPLSEPRARYKVQGVAAEGIGNWRKYRGRHPACRHYP